MVDIKKVYPGLNAVALLCFLTSFVLLQTTLIGVSDFDDGGVVTLKCPPITTATAADTVQLKMGLKVGTAVSQKLSADATPVPVQVTKAALGLKNLGVDEDLVALAPAAVAGSPKNICGGSITKPQTTTISLPRTFSFTCGPIVNPAASTLTTIEVVSKTSEHAEWTAVAADTTSGIVSMKQLTETFGTGNAKAVTALGPATDANQGALDNAAICDGSPKHVQVKRAGGQQVYLAVRTKTQPGPTAAAGAVEKVSTHHVDVTQKRLPTAEVVNAGQAKSKALFSSCLRELDDKKADTALEAFVILGALSIFIELYKAHRAGRDAEPHTGILELAVHLGAAISVIVFLVDWMDLGKRAEGGPCDSMEEPHLRKVTSAAAILWIVAFGIQVLCTLAELSESGLSAIKKAEERLYETVTSGALCVPRAIVCFIIVLYSAGAVMDGLDHNKVCAHKYVQPMYVGVLTAGLIGLGCALHFKKGSDSGPSPARWVLGALAAMLFTQWSIEHDPELIGSPFETCHDMGALGRNAPSAILYMVLIWTLYEAFFAAFVVTTSEGENWKSNANGIAGGSATSAKNILTTQNKPDRGMDSSSRLTKDKEDLPGIQFV